MYSDYEIQVVLDRFEERFAVLKNEVLGEFLWPIKCFPDSVKIGDMVKLEIVTSEQEKNKEYENMRQLLEELIN